MLTEKGGGGKRFSVGSENTYGERTFKRDKILLHGIDGFVGDDRSAIFELGGYVDGFPFYWGL